MLKVARSSSILMVLILIISACNLPSNAPATEEPNNVVLTAAALTVEAQLTQAVPFVTPTLPIAPATNTPLGISTLAATVTRPPAASATSVCDLA